MAMHGDYLIAGRPGDPQERVPELSRRARGFASWAALRSLGRSGVVELVEGLAGTRAAFAEGAASRSPGARCSTTWSSPRSACPSATTTAPGPSRPRLLADGTTWMSGSRWHDRAIVRISVSNWSTTDDDVRRSLDALRRAAASAVAAG